MPNEQLILVNRHLGDLNPLIAGWEACDPGHSFGPAVRKYTLLHYVRRGRGTFQVDGRDHLVEPGQAFLILPDQVTTYTADPEDPWDYQWIGFDGTLSQRFAELPPVFPVSEAVSRRLLPRGEDAAVMEYQIAAGLFLLYAELFASRGSGNNHVSRVETYIRASYMQKLQVEQIARQMNLDRRYLSRIFKEKTGQSIQAYIVSVRLEEASQYLRRGHSVQETAHLCGYEDVSNFSKMLKKRYGISPAYWK